MMMSSTVMRAPTSSPATEVADLLSSPEPPYAVPRSSRALRPETDVCARFTKGCASRKWANAIKRLQAEVYPYVDKAMAVRLEDNGNEACKPAWIFFQTLAILFYEQESAGVTGPFIRHRGSYTYQHHNDPHDRDDLHRDAHSAPLPSTRDMRILLEYLLCVDYGVPPPPLSSVPVSSVKSFSDLARQLFDFVERLNESSAPPWQADIVFAQAACEDVYALAWRIGLDVKDVALMFYHFARMTGPAVTIGADSNYGFDHYRSYMDELKREVETPRGDERLLRKLSVDFNDVIPTAVFEWERKGLLLEAVRLAAAAHGIGRLTMDVAYPPPHPHHQHQQPRVSPGRLQGLGLGIGLGLGLGLGTGLGVGLADTLSGLTDNIFGFMLARIGNVDVNNNEDLGPSSPRPGTPAELDDDDDDDWELV